MQDVPNPTPRRPKPAAAGRARPAEPAGPADRPAGRSSANDARYRRPVAGPDADGLIMASRPPRPGSPPPADEPGHVPPLPGEPEPPPQPDPV